MRSRTVLADLASYAVEESPERLPEEAVHAAKRAIVDWFAAVLPGGAEPPASLLQGALAGEGRGAARVYPGGSTLPPRTAALINATAAHTLEFDDIFRDAVYHPGCATVSAALALAQDRGASGLELLRAVVVGYEIGTRIGATVNPAHYQYWHTTGTVGSFGAAAAASAVLGLGVDATTHALATAGTFAAGLQQAFRSECMSKPLHAGHAADVGVLAALAAERGVTGASDLLEGPAGFGRAMSRECDWTRAVEGLGARYNISATTFKNHGCCGHTFAAIDGMLELRRRHDLVPEDVERIHVDTYRTAVEVTGRFDPEGEFEARFSLPYVVCHALVHGSVRRDAFSPERLEDPLVRSLMGRVTLNVEPALDAAFPGRRAATVRVHTKDGRTLAHHQPTRRGDPDAPLDDRDLEEKLRELAAPVVGAEAAEHLLTTLWKLERLDARDVARLGTPVEEPAAAGAQR
jgi:2-methylcitrate dehydratase PrpD